MLECQSNTVNTRLVRCSITIDQDLLDQINQRAKGMDLYRSQYFRRLARLDLGQGEAAILQETPPLNERR